MEQKKLVRSNNKIVAGVCSGIAEYFEIDPTLVRIIYAALTIFSAAFPGVFLYIIMLLIMPAAPNANAQDAKNDKVEEAEVVE